MGQRVGNGDRVLGDISVGPIHHILKVIIVSFQDGEKVEVMGLFRLLQLSSWNCL